MDSEAIRSKPRLEVQELRECSKGAERRRDGLGTTVRFQIPGGRGEHTSSSASFRLARFGEGRSRLNLCPSFASSRPRTSRLVSSTDRTCPCSCRTPPERSPFRAECQRLVLPRPQSPVLGSTRSRSFPSSSSRRTSDVKSPSSRPPILATAAPKPFRTQGPRRRERDAVPLQAQDVLLRRRRSQRRRPPRVRRVDFPSCPDVDRRLFPSHHNNHSPDSPLRLPSPSPHGSRIRPVLDQGHLRTRRPGSWCVVVRPPIFHRFLTFSRRSLQAREHNVPRS